MARRRLGGNLGSLDILLIILDIMVFLVLLRVFSVI
jgi:hypothetical protein